MKVDLEKLLSANIEVIGKCNTPCREAAIEEAIGIVQDQKDYLDTMYIGVKNYAHFGDQREDHSYGMCPRHGSIVFEIRKKDRTLPFKENDIYYLYVSRDNPAVSLDKLIKEKIRLGKETAEINQVLESMLEVMK
mgnify:FL=1